MRVTVTPEPQDAQDAQRMADLERQLAHAMAEVARLRDEKAAAGDTSGAGSAYQPYVPGDARPEPTVTVDGAPVAAGDGRLTDAVRRGDGVVVQVDGQVVPIDSATALRDLFGSGLFTDLQQSLGLLPQAVEKHGFLPDPDKVERIVPGPRTVPLSLRLATTSLGPVELFVLFMLAVAPLALWILVPDLILFAALFGLCTFGIRARRLHRHRATVLQWGEVATVTGVSESLGSSSYTNVPMRRARGWDARWASYTGPGRRTEISFTVAGRPGVLTVGGAPYDGGVVLADPRDPSRALCVSQLAFSVKPGPDGELPRGLSAGGWLMMLLTVGSLVGLAAAVVGWFALLLL